MMNIAEQIKFEAFRRMLPAFDAVLARVGAMEEELGLTAPAVKLPEPLPIRGPIPGMAISDQRVFADLKRFNVEFGWVKARLAALEAALAPVGVSRSPAGAEESEHF